MSNQLIIGPARQSRTGMYADIIGSVVARQQQRQQQQAQAQDAYLKNIADSLMAVSSDPTEFQRRIKSIDPKVASAVLAKYPQVGMGPYQSPEQATAAAKAKAQLGDITSSQAQPQQPPMSMNDAFTATGAGVNPSAPSPFDVASSRNARNRAVYSADLPSELQKANLTQAVQGDAGLLGANEIENKQALTAEETQKKGEADRTFNQVTLPTLNQVTIPEGKAKVSLSGAQTAEANAGVPLKQAQTAETLAKTKNLNAYAPDETGAPNAAVRNVIAAAKTVAQRGGDVQAFIKTTTGRDPALAKAVGAELAKPENVSTLSEPKLPPAARTALAEVDPLIMQARTVLKAYEPYKSDNSLLGDVDRMNYVAYRAGKKPPDGTPAAELANTQMLGVQAGARLLKGGSRAFPALQMAMQHAPDGLVDTKANIYDKSSKLIHQLVNVHNSQMGYSLNTASGTPPVGALKVFPNNEVGKWDGQGWEQVP